jgi:hypothetical protein
VHARIRRRRPDGRHLRIGYYPLRMTVRLLAIAIILGLTGCNEPAPAAPTDAKAKADAKSKVDTKAHGDVKVANPHGDAKAADPHGGAPPMMASTAPTPKGPPREITPSGTTRTEKAAELSFAVPTEWETQKVTSPMRVAHFIVPGPGGDAEMIVFRFAGGAGGIDANIARWKGQFVAPEGKTLDDISKTSSFEVGKLKVTLVDIAGHYKAAERPGSDKIVEEDNQRMIAAIVEGSGDAFFFKLLGSAKTVDLWAKAYEDGLRAATVG